MQRGAPRLCVHAAQVHAKLEERVGGGGSHCRPLAAAAAAVTGCTALRRVSRVRPWPARTRCVLASGGGRPSAYQLFRQHGARGGHGKQRVHSTGKAHGADCAADGHWRAPGLGVRRRGVRKARNSLARHAISVSWRSRTKIGVPACIGRAGARTAHRQSRSHAANCAFKLNSTTPG